MFFIVGAVAVDGLFIVFQCRVFSRFVNISLSAITRYRADRLRNPNRKGRKGVTSFIPLSGEMYSFQRYFRDLFGHRVDIFGRNAQARCQYFLQSVALDVLFACKHSYLPLTTLNWLFTWLTRLVPWCILRTTCLVWLFKKANLIYYIPNVPLWKIVRLRSWHVPIQLALRQGAFHLLIDRCLIDLCKSKLWLKFGERGIATAIEESPYKAWGVLLRRLLIHARSTYGFHLFYFI